MTTEHATITRWRKRLEGISRATTASGLLKAARNSSAWLKIGHDFGPDRNATWSKPRRSAAAASAAVDALSTKYPRKRNLGGGNPVISSSALVERWEKIHYKGEFKGWSGSSVYADYGSYTRITTRRRCARWIVGGVPGRLLIAPRGMEWRHDANGLLLVRMSDGIDYHPTDEDLTSADWVKRCRRGLAEAWRRRQQDKAAARVAAQSQAAFERRTASTRVTLLDSRRAGNCLAGSLSWAERALHVSRDSIMDAPWLVGFSAKRLRVAASKAGDHDRVEAAIRAADARETLVCI